MVRFKVYEWHRRFTEDRESIEDNERVGRPSTLRNSKDIALVSEYARNNCETLAQIAALFSKTSCHRILAEDLNMHQVSQHIVPRLLTSEQTEERMAEF
ncbi:hypothetical protein TNCV_2664771 [Trichonephila clavipes]|nr:hypothetical protein TNCV_2664771 [Trichonephila clavipes]